MPFDLEFAVVTLKTADGASSPTSRGLCAGSSSTLRNLFQTSPAEKVFTLPKEVNTDPFETILRWLHGSLDMRLYLHYEDAAAIMRVADFLGL